MVVIFQQGSELIQTHGSIFIVIVLLKLLFSYFFIILFLNQIHKIQVIEYSFKKCFERLLFNLLSTFEQVE